MVKKGFKKKKKGHLSDKVSLYGLSLLVTSSF